MKALGLSIVAFAAAGCATTGPTLSPAIDLAFGLRPAWAIPFPGPAADKRIRIAPTEIADKLKVGDVARAQMTWDKAYLFRVDKIGDDAFWGTASNDKQYKVLYKDIAALRVKRKKSDGELLADYLLSGVMIVPVIK